MYFLYDVWDSNKHLVSNSKYLHVIHCHGNHVFLLFDFKISVIIFIIALSTIKSYIIKFKLCAK